MIQHGITCDSPLNTYSIPKLAKRGPRDETVIRGGKRLDYVLFRSPSTLSSGVQLKAEGTRIVLVDLIPGLGVSYSDHFGLEAILSFVPSSSPSPITQDEGSFSTEDLLRLLHTLRTSLSHAQSSSTSLLKLFALALAFIPILCITSSYQPLPYLNWIWTLLAIADGAAGATMLYCGFVGGYWEIGALKNVIAEVEGEAERRKGETGSRGGSSRGSW